MKVSLLIVAILVVQCYSAPFGKLFSWPWKKWGKHETAQPAAPSNGENNQGASIGPALVARSRRQVHTQDVPAEASQGASADTPDVIKAAEDYKQQVEQHPDADKHHVESAPAQSAGENVEIVKQEYHQQQQSHSEVQQPPQYQNPVQQPPQYQSPVQQPPQYQSPVQQPPQYPSPVQQPPQHQSPVQNQEPPRHESSAPRPPQSPVADHNVNANSGYQSAPNPERNEIEKDEPNKPINADDELRSAISNRPSGGGFFGPMMTMFNDVRNSITAIEHFRGMLHNVAVMTGICPP